MDKSPFTIDSAFKFSTTIFSALNLPSISHVVKKFSPPSLLKAIPWSLIKS
jgi:hypothetical protein